MPRENQAYLLVRAAKQGATILGPGKVEVVHEPRRTYDRYPWHLKDDPDVRYRSQECYVVWPDGTIAGEETRGTRIRPPKPSRPRRLGWCQATIIRTMQKPNRDIWHPLAGWAIDDATRTVQVMETLAKRGLVEKIAKRTYRITPAGLRWKVY